MKRPYRQHLKSDGDLETSYEATRAGFVAFALEKNRCATPFVERARSLKAAAERAKRPRDLLTMEDIYPCILAAAGISDKAAGHLDDVAQREAIRGLLEQYLEPAGSQFVEELVYRFLLTRGDTLSGAMKNVVGKLAERKLARAVISQLRNAARSYQWRHQQCEQWIEAPVDDADLELVIKGLSWETNGRPRVFVYNLVPPFLNKKNVDISLFTCTSGDLANERTNPASYLALGELKGGSDPAGADEHWKTARSTLARIRKGFSSRNMRPLTFFVGAAIEGSMATEIWNMLEAGELDNAANLTSETQLASLVRWLCTL